MSIPPNNSKNVEEKKNHKVSSFFSYVNPAHTYNGNNTYKLSSDSSSENYLSNHGISYSSCVRDFTYQPSPYLLPQSNTYTPFATSSHFQDSIYLNTKKPPLPLEPYPEKPPLPSDPYIKTHLKEVHSPVFPSVITKNAPTKPKQINLENATKINEEDSKSQYEVETNQSMYLIRPRNSWGTSTIDLYEILNKVGEGMYGYVYRAREKKTNQIVALKKIRQDSSNQGFPITAIREVKILRKLVHPNVVCLKDVSYSADTVAGEKKNSDSSHVLDFYLVFEYLEHDLSGIIESGEVDFSINQIRSLMRQLFLGVGYCHDKNILHRDIKGSNLLISSKGVLKVADFGLARTWNENRSHTNKVITLWYRPPELLLESDIYGPGIDIWSIGCILGELLTKKPLFPGRDEISQLECISRICGSPRENIWPGVQNLSGYNKISSKFKYKRRLKEAFEKYDSESVELLDSLLLLNPESRPSCYESLCFSFFSHADQCFKFNLNNNYHEYECKGRRQQGH